jgi:glucose/arabinose dehydrogenase/PKD repeat protein
MARTPSIVLAVFLGAVGLGFSSEAFAAIPAGFIDELVTAATGPTAIDFTPDGRLLIARQSGVLIVRQGTTNTTAVTFPASQICSNFERGLLGVAVDPNFGPGAGQNRFIYLFYTFHKTAGLCTDSGTAVNRVSRFVLADANTVDLATETILIDNMPSTAGNHNAGDVEFGKDGYLYITIGDGGADYAGGGSGGTNDAARDEFTLTGKVLRITKDGGIPPTNPFQGAGTARCNVTGGTTAGNKCQETYSWGHRNPFRIAFDPNVAGTRFFINDVGQNVREEIDLGTSGADFGWNCREGTRVNNTGGPCNPTPPNMIPPIFEYSHGAQVPGSTSSTSCNSITGGAFVPNGIWPAAYDNVYLFSDYVCGWIFQLAGANGGGPFTTASDFATNLGGSSAVALRFGPYQTTQALYYTTFAGGGQVRRVRYSPVAGNNPPNASFTANPLGGAAPLMVNFDGSASSDPDAGNTLTYFWTFGDGTPETSTATATMSHTYLANGNYVASLRVRDNNFAFSTPATQTIQVGNTPPSASIVFPTASDRFFVGQTITLNGFATDSQDGPYPDGSLVWTVRLHHNEHTHPLLGPVNGNHIMFVAPAPEDVPALDTSFVEIDLSVTDSGGLIGTDHLDFQPNRVATTFATSPPGLTTVVNGTPLIGPTTINPWQAWTMNVDAPSPQTLGGTSYGFANWSDAGAQSHAIVTSASPATYTASFTPLGPASLNYFTVTPCRLVDTRNANGPFGGPALAANATRSFVATGQCGVPTGAQAIAANLTVVGPTSGGSLSAGPSGAPIASISAINFSAGQVRTNNAVVTLSASGGFDVFAGLPSGSTHLVLDVLGYFQ